MLLHGTTGQELVETSGGIVAQLNAVQVAQCKAQCGIDFHISWTQGMLCDHHVNDLS